jgi:pimeloyl-ACP methyl ester carboxylesterase
MLHYTVQGKGKPVVFIHGFCETSEIWARFTPFFTPHFQVICVDLPGFGKSEGLGYETSMERMAFLLKETLDTANIEKPVLIGHSLGGYVALAYAEMFPESLAGFCLFHSTAFEDAPEKKENRNKTIEYVEKYGVDAFCNPFVPGLFFHKRRESLKPEIEETLVIARQTSLDSIVNTTKAMRDRKERIEVLENSTVPVAFIVGKDDTAVTFDKSLAQCHLPKQSQTLFLSETGHMGMFERPEECAKFLKGFIHAC